MTSKNTKQKKTSTVAEPTAKVKVVTYIPQWAHKALADSCLGLGPLDPVMAKGRTVSSLICHLITEGDLAESAPATKEA